MAAQYDPPSAFALHVRYGKVLDKLFRKRPELRKQFAVNGHSSSIPWQKTLAGRLATYFCAAREMYWREIGYAPTGRAPPVSPSNMDLYTYQILLNQEPLFDHVPGEIREEWRPFHSLFAALRDHDSLNDPIIKHQLQQARRRAAALRAATLRKERGIVSRSRRGRAPPKNHPPL